MTVSELGAQTDRQKIGTLLNNEIVDSRVRPWTATHNQYFRPKLGRNLGCYACRVLSPLRNTHDEP